MPPFRINLPQGTLDLLILRALKPDPLHGWAISERIQQVSSEVLQIQQGSLYPALHRLERKGWIKARWGVSDNNRMLSESCPEAELAGYATTPLDVSINGSTEPSMQGQLVTGNYFSLLS
jgi:hypothetical protein